MSLPTKKFQVSDITVRRYIRSAPSEERIMLFQDLYTSDEANKVPPITVKPNGELIDGRHRLIALQRLDAQETQCYVDASVHDVCDLTLAAIKANVGGSKDLTFHDIRKSIIDLLAEGFAARRIRAGLPYPKSMAKRLVQDAQSHWKKARTNAAVIAVKRKELTVEQAAITYKVDAEDITCIIRREEQGEGDAMVLASMGSAKGNFTNRYNAFSKRMTGVFKKLAEKYEMGEYTEAQVVEIIAHALHCSRVHLGHMQDWQARFSVMIQTRRPILPPSGEKIPPKKIESGAALQ